MAKKMTEYADAESPGIRAAFTNTAGLFRRVQEYRFTYTRTVRQRVCDATHHAATLPTMQHL